MCASGRIEQQCLNDISNHLSKNSIKSSTLSLQTAWTMNSLDETECTHVPLLSIKDFVVATFHQSRA